MDLFTAGIVEKENDGWKATVMHPKLGIVKLQKPHTTKSAAHKAMKEFIKKKNTTLK